MQFDYHNIISDAVTNVHVHHELCSIFRQESLDMCGVCIDNSFTQTHVHVTVEPL